MQKCPFCQTDLDEREYNNHINTFHTKSEKSIILDDPDSQLTTDDSGKIIYMREYRELRGGRSNNIDSEKRYLNIKSVIRLDDEGVFKKIAQSKDVLPLQVRQPLKIECRYCQKFVEKNKIKEHNFQKHQDELPLRASFQSSQSIKSKVDQDYQNNVTFAPEGEEGNIAEKLKQFLDETRYGAKGMHHRHEWDGKFGSTPLHDDYGDEASSE